MHQILAYKDGRIVEGVTVKLSRKQAEDFLKRAPWIVERRTWLGHELRWGKTVLARACKRIAS